MKPILELSHGDPPERVEAKVNQLVRTMNALLAVTSTKPYFGELQADMEKHMAAQDRAERGRVSGVAR